MAALEVGQHTWWVAIEISGRISTIPSGDVNHGVQECPERSGIYTGPSGQHRRGDVFEFGSLYDLSVEILPTGNSSILQVLREQPFPVSISAGSSILILAQIQIDVKHAPQARHSRHGHVRHNSEDLMEDLAAELGDARLGYAHIRVSYRHSAFPTFKDAASVGGGVSSVQSRVDTVATASINLHNSQSPWSPPPARFLGTLLPLLQRHWGVDKAIAAMRQMENHTCAPRTLAKAKSQVWSQLEVKDDTHQIAIPKTAAHASRVGDIAKVIADVIAWNVSRGARSRSVAVANGANRRETAIFSPLGPTD
ncbi:hypothetical protein QQZ08_001953 [Neonectria magnoliae]|uniref:Uncharacterized protein n=1 Tax=Neonectria magnoliae TaxID=2732573 RepID=A0ABR1IF35_9HYPO